jgi:V/A-type H+-transporting ATPase subunit E
MQRFSGEVRRLVGKIMEPEAFMEKLILQVVDRVSGQAKLEKQTKFSLKLPQGVIGIEELRKTPEELKEGTLSHFVLSVMATLLREGIELKASTEFDQGIKIYLKEGDVEVDLTDQAISSVLMEHLQPRFRALLEGVVK